MAVANMKKLTVFVYADDTERVLHRLIRLRCVSVENTPADAPEWRREDCDRERTEAERAVGRIAEALIPLHKYTVKRKKLFSPRKEIVTAAFVSDGRYEKAREVVRQTQKTLADLTAARARTTSLRGEMQSLLPWLAYDLPLDEKATKNTTVLTGILPSSVSVDALADQLADAAAELTVVNRDGAGIYVSVLYYNPEEEAVLRLLSEYGLVRATFGTIPAPGDTAEVAYARVEEQLRQSEAQCDSLEERLTALAADVDLVEVLYDIEKTRLTMLENKAKLSAFGSCRIITGWVPADCRDRVSEALDSFACAYELSDPEPGEIPPVLLRNNGFATNFEWVLGMYSYPAYGTFDPTMIMSIFYFIIFGLMFADVGYGLLLTLGCFGAVKLMHPRESMKRFLYMFGYCGISCMIMGLIFGGWFSDMPTAILQNMFGIENAKERFGFFNGLWFNPIDEPMTFLVVSLGIGALHLVTGMAIKFWLLCREGHIWDAILDIGLYWVLFAGLGLMFAAPAVGPWVAGGAALLIVLTHGRKKKNLFGKITGGLLGLYDLISYASDLLSYSRILALGLAAAVIGQVVNILGTMAGGGVVGFLALIVAFLIGHVLNLALNVLGTFVHTSRLQYIEFFGKFFEDGGVPFKPQTPSDTYTVE